MLVMRQREVTYATKGIRENAIDSGAIKTGILTASIESGFMPRKY